MKKVLALVLLLIGLVSSAQNYEFDYLLEYRTDEGESLDYYINSQDHSYFLYDNEDKQIISAKNTVFFSISLKGETRINHIELLQENNKVIVSEPIADKTESLYGYSCKRYLYKTMLPEGEGNALIPVTFELYMTDTPLDTASVLNDNKFLVGYGAKFNNLPKGTIVKFGNTEGENYEAYTTMNLVKVIKLDKVLKLDITKQQVAEFVNPN